MIEVGAIVGPAGKVVYWWHAPAATSVGIPDSRELWDIFWEMSQRDRLVGFAHTHPGGGMPGPSWEDLTTFAAIEDGLGKRLTWWIVNEAWTVVLHFVGPTKYEYALERVDDPPWAPFLRQWSIRLPQGSAHAQRE